MGTCQCPGQVIGLGGGLPCGLCWPIRSGTHLVLVEGCSWPRVLEAPGKEGEEPRGVAFVGEGRREAGEAFLRVSIGIWQGCGGAWGLSLEGPGELVARTKCRWHHESIFDPSVVG